MIRFVPFIAVLATLLLFTGMTIAQDAAPLSKDDVKALVEEYIKDNPKTIIEALQNFEVQQREQEEAAATERLSNYEDYLKNGDLPRVGNPEGDIQIVEFFDYNCGYCKQAFNDLQILLQADPNVQVTFVEMPILGEPSLEAAKWSMAAEAQEDKYFNYHAAIMSFSGQKTEANLRTLANSAGLDVEALTVKAKDAEVIDKIEKNIQIARDIGIRGTPGFIINGEIYRGYLGYEGLKAVIDEIRMSAEDSPETIEEAPAS